MSLTVAVEAPPLAADAQGVVHVAGTRITLDTLVSPSGHAAAMSIH